MRPLNLLIASLKSPCRAIPCKPCKIPVTLLFLGHSNVEQEKEREIISLCWGRRQHPTVVLKKLKKLSKHMEWKSGECIKGFLRTLLYYICKKNTCRSNFKTWGPLMASSQTICVLKKPLLWRLTVGCKPLHGCFTHQHAIYHDAVGFGWISNLDSFNFKLTVLSALPRTGHQHSTFPLAVCCRGHLSVKKRLLHQLFSHILFHWDFFSENFDS